MTTRSKLLAKKNAPSKHKEKHRKVGESLDQLSRSVEQIERRMAGLANAVESLAHDMARLTSKIDAAKGKGELLFRLFP